MVVVQIAPQALAGPSDLQPPKQSVGSPSQEVARPLYSRAFKVLLVPDHGRKSYAGLDVFAQLDAASRLA